MNTTTSTQTCTACASLARMGIQCNTHRRTDPSARTLKGRAILTTVAETGCTVAEAEAFHGVTAGPVIR